MMWTVIFPKSIYKRMRTTLFQNMLHETGCFLLGHSYTTKSCQFITITKIIESTSDSWQTQAGSALEPTSEYVNRAAVEADWENASLFFIHTHPGFYHPTSQSSIDAKTDRDLFSNLAEILPDRPLGSFILSRQGLTGIILQRGKKGAIRDFRIAGLTNSSQNGSKAAKKRDSDRFDRQTRAIGQANHDRIAKSTAAVVGVGGTGSAVAVQLARMGIGRLVLVDRDVLDRTNLPRVYGSKPEDIGNPKVDLLKRHIAEFSETRVNAIRADITKDNILPSLLECDVIFGCTDNLTSRAFLNDLAIQYYIPLIDSGCRIALDHQGATEQVVAKVQVVTPDSACLWCTETLDGRTIMQESLTVDERKKLVAEGYLKAVDEQPSITSLTSLTASIAVAKFLDTLGIYGEDYETRTMVELKDWFMVSDSPQIKETCICQKRRGLGQSRVILQPSSGDSNQSPVHLQSIKSQMKKHSE